MDIDSILKLIGAITGSICLIMLIGIICYVLYRITNDDFKD